jgi:D-aspartate ligase
MNWFVHGSATADWTTWRSFPSTRGITTLGRWVTNDVLLYQAESLLKAISYAGIMDIDYRLDKLTSFWTSIHASERSFACWWTTTASMSRERSTATSPDTVRRSRQIDGRVLVCRARRSSCQRKRFFWRGELSASAWLYSFKGRKEFAWFSWDDPLPFLMVRARFAIRGDRIGPFKTTPPARRLAWVKIVQTRPGDADPAIRLVLWYSLISIVGSPKQ